MRLQKQPFSCSRRPNTAAVSQGTLKYPRRHDVSYWRAMKTFVSSVCPSVCEISVRKPPHKLFSNSIPEIHTNSCPTIPIFTHKWVAMGLTFLHKFLSKIHFIYLSIFGGPNSSVGIATRYGLDGREIESRWGARFSAPVQTGPGTHPTSYIMGTGSFPWVKRPGRGADQPPPFSAEVEGSVELYIYSPSGLSWPVLW